MVHMNYSTKAKLSVSSPKTGETCNCETGDHANAGGQEHGMFNQDIGRQTWQGQGLPQPKQDKGSCQCDEKPSEANKVPNADARLGDDEDEKKKAEDYMGLTEAEGNIVCSACGNQLKNHFGKAEDDAPDIEPISGTSTGSGTRAPKKYTKKPNADNPKGIISEEWKKHRAAQRVSRGDKKRRLQADKLMETMSPEVKLNYERNMKDLNPKPDKRSVRNTNRKPMSQEKLHERKTKLTGRKRRKKMWLQIKAILNRLKTERGDGTWGMRGLGEGAGTTDVQGSGDTHLISPVKQKELDKLMAGARYMPRSVTRRKE